MSWSSNADGRRDEAALPYRDTAAVERGRCLVKRNNVITVDAAARVMLNGDTVATGGFVGIGFPSSLLSRWSTVSLPPAPRVA